MFDFLKDLFLSDKVKYSTYIDTYKRLAAQYGVSVTRVYDLAHGRHSENEKEQQVKRVLKQEGII